MKDTLKKAMDQEAKGAVPSFDQTWHAAETRYAASKRRYRAFASVAAAVAVVAIVVSLQPLPEPAGFVTEADLLCGTSWEAPSDAWLPEYEFDIYQDLPTLTEST